MHLRYRWLVLLVLVIGFYVAFYSAVRRDHILVWTGSQVRCTDEGDRLLGNLVPSIFYVVFFPAHRLETLFRAGPLACVGWGR